jgi:glucose-6-phosphate dehydrogenase assembly protein OpcA
MNDEQLNNISEHPFMSTHSPARSWVDVNAIERELTSLWQQASEDEDHGVIRSSILNLLVYAPKTTDAGIVDNMLADITAAHPCRAVLIVADSTATPATLEAQVTSRCTLPTGSSKQVCCEQVTITAAGEAVDDVPSAVAPLLLSDLPVYLWWRAVPRIQDKALFWKLADISDRVIIDSAFFNDPHGDIVKMAAVLKNSPRWTAISDLNWARLTAWRALLAGFYDISEYRAELDRVERVVIEYAPSTVDVPVIPARALLLGGWLASRLGWQVKGDKAKRTDGSTSFELSSEQNDVAVEFKHATREIEPGHIAQVTLGCTNDESRLFTVKRSQCGKRIETSIRSGEAMRVQRVLSYESLSEAELIAREIEILGHDRVYEQAVMAAGKLIAALT